MHSPAAPMFGMEITVDPAGDLFLGHSTPIEYCNEDVRYFPTSSPTALSLCAIFVCPMIVARVFLRFFGLVSSATTLF